MRPDNQKPSEVFMKHQQEEEPKTLEVTDEPKVTEDKGEKEIRISGCIMLNLRKTPAITNNVLAVIDKYTRIEVLKEMNEDWSKVTIIDSGKELTGYVMSKFLKEV